MAERELCNNFVKSYNISPGINTVPVSESHSQLMERHFHRDNRAGKVRNSEMCDHPEKDHKRGKTANSKSQQMKHHHQNQGHRQHHHQLKLHQPDGNDSQE